ncbi:MAG: hypothetical protein OI74_09180 [Gammaproteobacteria bacterium (ex Lamellibrachia satsuma)]|nr:MAG: hypothetical protein HPY30_14050 [Gammaproteobacteria bacterium (ex Lamellibrachia satsuma)]RRS33042.1 MAG: hypothetical protein OI74_09180 [Gammaproteobacteria bacterium (ex Lamellibrachia satsuma)]RRS36881.1 MAG: hypothetical protein NV67_04360 [Gammaproteobacteria bacterium (ex Lamellibrachia satsuma)]
MVSLGKAWIVLEESFHSGQKQLVAVLSPRKTSAYVAEYIEQAYVDRFANFDEKITFKKNRKNSPYRIERYMIGDTTISHGHEPIFNAYYAHKLERDDRLLRFHYRIYKGDFDSREVTEYIEEVRIA